MLRSRSRSQCVDDEGDTWNCGSVYFMVAERFTRRGVPLDAIARMALGLAVWISSPADAAAQTAAATEPATRAAHPPETPREPANNTTAADTVPPAAGAPSSPAAQENVAAAANFEPDAATQAEYRDVVARAITEFDLGHAAEARALFLRAHALWPSARTRRTLGMTAFELRMYPRALDELEGALDDPHRPLPAEQRAQVIDLIGQTKAFVGRYQLQVEPADAELLVDGTRQPIDRALVIGVGIHQMTVRAPGYSDLYRELVVQGREDEPLQLRLARLRPEPLAVPAAQPVPDLSVAAASTAPADSSRGAPSDSKPSRVAALVMFGVAGLGAAVGTTSGIVAFTKKHDTDHTVGYLAADVSTAAWIVAGGAGVTGVLLWVFAWDSEPDRAALRPVVSVSSIGLAGTL